MLTIAAARPQPLAVRYTDYAGQFDDFEARTRVMPAVARVKAFRSTFEQIRPGLYASSDQEALDRRIQRSLEAFPALRPAYRSVERHFGANLSQAVAHFRRVFPDFTSPLPIILAHELGVRDGGSDYINGKKVMLFGADMIARLHNDESLQPFLEHELFHLEHAKHFADCDQFWCLLWQEGLATYAASVMTPGASDHQLLLDQPGPIREPTDRRWPQALCEVEAHFDGTDAEVINHAFTGAHGDSSSELPSRYGYYLGLRLAEEAAQHASLPALARFDDAQARPVLAKALASLIDKAHAPCRGPAFGKSGA